MKIFVAGKMEDADIIVDIMNDIEDSGHTVTCDWIDLAKRKVGRERYAVENIEGVRNCDMLIAYMVTEYIYRCQFAEIGMALIENKPVIIIGKMFEDCIFRHHPFVTVVDDIGSALDMFP